MNFLGHLYLSKHNDELMIGNFIGDAVKGKNFEGLTPGIINGVMMHRHIDTFTDTHPMVAQSKAKLQPRYKKYAGVIVDVFYDHFLAINWAKYHQLKLADFAQQVYDLIEPNLPNLPAKTQHLFPYMKQYNWLLNYSKVEGIHRTLSGMAQRTSFVSNMEFAQEELLQYYDEFNAEFQSFFVDIQTYVKQNNY